MKTTKRFYAGFAALTMTFFVISKASAVTLSLDPPSQTAAPPDIITVDLVIDGLGDFAPDSLGAFDIDVSYDPAALSLSGFTLGSFLGDIALFEAIDVSLGDLGGIVNVAELSLLEPDFPTCIFCIPPFLDDIQPASFPLATFDFMVNVLSQGSSTTIGVDTVFALGDSFGLPLTVEGTSNAVIRNPAISPIPEPAMLLLVGMGLAGLASWRRHRPT